MTKLQTQEYADELLFGELRVWKNCDSTIMSRYHKCDDGDVLLCLGLYSENVMLYLNCATREFVYIMHAYARTFTVRLCTLETEQ